jgi:RNA polymerase sigma factor (sigma-70 family)
VLNVNPMMVRKGDPLALKALGTSSLGDNDVPMPSTSEPLVGEDEREVALAAIDRLDERDRYVLRMRAQGMTQQEIGSRIGRTKGRTEQIQRQAINKVRSQLGITV